MTNLLVKIFVKNTEDRTAFGWLSGWVGILCNLLLFAGKFLAGTISGSVAIAADAFNNLSDGASSVISLIGFKLASKPADPEHPYGHARYEYLAGLSVSILIILIGVELLQNSIDKILHPGTVHFSWLTIGILLFSIVLKLWMAHFNYVLGKRIHSKALTATAADSRNDVITTTAVLTATLVAHFSSFSLDGYMGVIVALFILYSGIGLVKDTLNPLLGQAPDPEFVSYIEKKILSYEHVLGTHDLMVHDYGPGRQFASVHVEMAAERDVLESHDIIDNIERDFLKDDHLNLIIHYDPIITGDAALNDLHSWLSEQLKTIHPELTLHDLRIVPGKSHCNVIFDCVKPYSCSLTPKELKTAIQELVAVSYPEYRCIITVDLSYAAIPPTS